MSQIDHAKCDIDHEGNTLTTDNCIMAILGKACGYNVRKEKMPDISMCNNAECVQHEDCYRFRAVPSKHRQAYGGFVPVDGVCKYFIEVCDSDSVFDSQTEQEGRT